MNVGDKVEKKESKISEQSGKKFKYVFLIGILLIAIIVFVIANKILDSKNIEYNYDDVVEIASDGAVENSSVYKLQLGDSFNLKDYLQIGDETDFEIISLSNENAVIDDSDNNIVMVADGKVQIEYLLDGETHYFTLDSAVETSNATSNSCVSSTASTSVTGSVTKSICLKYNNGSYSFMTDTNG